jgi:hypothetical protein
MDLTRIRFIIIKKQEPWKSSTLCHLHWDIHQKLFVLGQYSKSLLHHKQGCQEPLFQGSEYPLHLLCKSVERNIPPIPLSLPREILQVLSTPLRYTPHSHKFRKNELCFEHHLYTPHNSYDRLTQRNNTFDSEH